MITTVKLVTAMATVGIEAPTLVTTIKTSATTGYPYLVHTIYDELGQPLLDETGDYILEEY